MKEVSGMEEKYVLTISKKQAVLLKDALEEYFRIRMNQWNMLAESLALMSIDISPEHPNHKENFERFLCKRDDIELIFETVGKILGCSYRSKKSEEQSIAEDIWQVIRHQLWKDSENKNEWCVDSRDPLRVSKEPLPEIKKIGE